MATGPTTPLAGRAPSAPKWAGPTTTTVRPHNPGASNAGATLCSLTFAPLSTGTFFMSWDDFHKHFSEVCIVAVRDSFSFTSLRLGSLPPDSLIGVEVVIKTPGEIVFELHQPSKRNFIKDFGFQCVSSARVELPSTPPSSSPFLLLTWQCVAGCRYGGLGFEIQRMGDPQDLRQSLHAKSQTVVLDLHLEPGRYLVTAHGCVDPKRRCFLSTYTSSAVSTRVLKSSPSDIEGLIKPVLEAMALKKGTP